MRTSSVAARLDLVQTSATVNVDLSVAFAGALRPSRAARGRTFRPSRPFLKSRTESDATTELFPVFARTLSHSVARSGVVSESVATRFRAAGRLGPF